MTKSPPSCAMRSGTYAFSMRTKPSRPRTRAMPIRALNLMMRRWEASGLALGWTDVASVTDDLPAPPRPRKPSATTSR
jgi:hypothetical protein